MKKPNSNKSKNQSGTAASATDAPEDVKPTTVDEKAKEAAEAEKAKEAVEAEKAKEAAEAEKAKEAVEAEKAKEAAEAEKAKQDAEAEKAKQDAKPEQRSFRLTSTVVTGGKKHRANQPILADQKSHSELRKLGCIDGSWSDGKPLPE